MIYVPFRQQPTGSFSILARTSQAELVAQTLRTELRNIDPDLPLYNVMTFDEFLSRERLGPQILSTLFGTFAIIGLVLSAVGIYGVTAHSVSHRTQEIGVRMALGAQKFDIAWLILKQGFRQLLMGLPLGLAGALAVSRVLRNQLFGIEPSDPLTIVTISLLLIGVVIAACLIPADRASRLSSAEALRSE